MHKHLYEVPGRVQFSDGVSKILADQNVILLNEKTCTLVGGCIAAMWWK